MEESTFKYEPLDLRKDSIRLVRFKGVDNSGRPLLEMHRTKVSASQYYAISYTWGSSIERFTIIINGQRLQVGRNLYDFLLQMTVLNDELCEFSNKDSSYLIPSIQDLDDSGATVRRLQIREQENRKSALATVDKNDFTDGFWIDAICLDQNNLRERNHQVSQMYDIYLRAKAVIAWIGSGDLDIYETLSIFEQIHHATDDLELRSLLQLPYWRRAWVVQELYAAKRILLLYGKYLISWERFWARLSKMPYLPRPLNGMQDDAPGVWLRKQAAYYHFLNRRGLDIRGSDCVQAQIGSERELVEVLQTFGNLDCMDPRDRIFSVRSILAGGNAFSVQYNQSALTLAIRAIIHFGIAELSRSVVLQSLNIELSECKNLPQLRWHQYKVQSDNPNALVAWYYNVKPTGRRVIYIMRRNILSLCLPGSARLDEDDVGGLPTMHLYTSKWNQRLRHDRGDETARNTVFLEVFSSSSMDDCHRFGPFHREHADHIGDWLQRILDKNRIN